MEMIKSSWTVLAVLAAISLMVACGGGTGDVNVIFISIDTLRADHLGCYGYGRDTSPTLDRFAEKAILCRNAFSHSPKTAPSHMSMFTSLYPTVHGVHMYNRQDKERLGPVPFRLDDKIKPLAEVMRENGYACVAFTGGGNVGPEYGFDRGFEIYQTVRGHWQNGIDWIEDNRQRS